METGHALTPGTAPGKEGQLLTLNINAVEPFVFSCGNVNFARRSECNRCGSGRPAFAKGGKTTKVGIEIGKSAAEKSGGLFAAEDWQCSKCGNVNWARRSTCNVCNGPKVSEEESRTGLGGGFNERGVVEYKSHDSDSDEYDDFGRKKKKYRKMSDGGGGPEVKRSKREVESEVEEDEEEEEDDDDEDLGKYDLWGDDDGKKEDEKPAATALPSKKNGNGSEKSKSVSRDRRRSRSRSYSRSRSRSRTRSRDKRRSKKSSRRSRSS